MDKALAKRIRETIRPVAEALSYVSDESLASKNQIDPYWRMPIHSRDLLKIRRLFWELGGEQTCEDNKGDGK